MQNKKTLALVLLGVLALGAQFFPQQFQALQSLLGAGTASQDAQPDARSGEWNAKGSVASRGADTDYTRLEQAIAGQEFEVWLQELRFETVKLLRDDLEGSRHQRFLVSANGLPTILVAHNIDLAERVPLREGDTVWIRGRYEWNNKGGVLHWTHHDPRGRIEGGWVRHEGKVFK